MPERKHGIRTYSSFTMISICPDVCLTPCGSSLIPIPYTIIAFGDNLENLSNDVNMTSFSTARLDSTIPVCYGDEGGSGGGYVSGTTGSTCEFVEHRGDIHIDGVSAVTESQYAFMNCKNTCGINYDDSPKIGPAAIGAVAELVGIAEVWMDDAARAVSKDVGKALKSAAKTAGIVGSFLTLDSVLHERTPEAQLDAASKEIVKLVALMLYGTTLPYTLTISAGFALIEYGPGAVNEFVRANREYQDMLKKPDVDRMRASAEIANWPRDSAAYKMARGFGF